MEVFLGIPYRDLYCFPVANLPVDEDLNDLPFENERGEPNEFLFDLPNDLVPPKDRDPNERMPLPPKLDLASETDGTITKESMLSRKSVIAYKENFFIVTLK